MSTGAQESRPRLCAGLVILPAAGGLLIEGGPRRHLLTGAAATSVVRKMLPLLDGQHTLGRLAAVMDLPAGRVQQAVGLLDQCGLLEEGASLPAGALSPASDVALSLSRHVNVTRVRRRSGALAAALADSAVLLTAPPEIARLVADDLRAAGVGQVMCSPRLRPRDMRAVASAQRGMVVLEDDTQDEGQSADIEDACRDLTHLDAGCAAAQLAAVGRGYGLTVSFAPRWDDQLADLLELYPGGEIITAVAGIAEPESQPCR